MTEKELLEGVADIEVVFHCGPIRHKLGTRRVIRGNLTCHLITEVKFWSMQATSFRNKSSGKRKLKLHFVHKHQGSPWILWKKKNQQLLLNRTVELLWDYLETGCTGNTAQTEQWSPLNSSITLKPVFLNRKTKVWSFTLGVTNGVCVHSIKSATIC